MSTDPKPAPATMRRLCELAQDNDNNTMMIAAKTEMHCRCSPPTMLAVMEVLETASQVGEIRFRSSALSRDADDRIKAAIQLLNATSEHAGGAE